MCSSKVFPMTAMNITKFSAPLKEAWYEAPDVRVLRVDCRQEFKPGQFYMVGFDGLPGKAMSVCSSPTKPYMDFGAKLTESEHKKKWASIGKGERVTMQGPYGLFTLQEDESKICLIAGGIGITPFVSYLQYAFDKKLETDFALLYSNKTLQDRAFSKQFLEMQEESGKTENNYCKIKLVETLTRGEEANSWSGLRGRIDKKMIEGQVPEYSKRLFYVCGVPEMVKDVSAMLYEIGVDRKRVKREEFTGLH